jgi:hypothetical protein
MFKRCILLCVLATAAPAFAAPDPCEGIYTAAKEIASVPPYELKSVDSNAVVVGTGDGNIILRFQRSITRAFGRPGGVCTLTVDTPKRDYLTAPETLFLNRLDSKIGKPPAPASPEHCPRLWLCCRKPQDV